jgi:hypothetical protein
MVYRGILAFRINITLQALGQRYIRDNLQPSRAKSQSFIHYYNYTLGDSPLT